MRASGVVWKEAPELAIHMVQTGGVTLMVVNACAKVTLSHLTCQGEGEVGGVKDGAKGVAPANMATGGGLMARTPAGRETTASRCAPAMGRGRMAREHRQKSTPTAISATLARLDERSGGRKGRRGGSDGSRDAGRRMGAETRSRGQQVAGLR
jgi:hypothetical protein